jgi:2-polyprenyl-3-methyl-5-hydroxy-6-metoxy-1,4-benzoquinol methylase
MDKTKLTIDSYQSCAEAYQKKFMNLESMYGNFMHDFEVLLKAKSKILDLGCGPGNFSKFLISKNKGYSVDGIDLSSEMVRLAKENVPGGNFSIKDIRGLEYPESSYDAVIASFCFVHLTNGETRLVIADLSKIIKEKGWLYISVMEGDKNLFESSSFSNGGEFFYNFYSEKFLVNTLMENDFTIVRVDRQDYQELDGTVTIDMSIFAQKK